MAKWNVLFHPRNPHNSSLHLRYEEKADVTFRYAALAYEPADVDGVVDRGEEE